MSKVQILPPEVISKIAAGEVIDRPASVIKELIENSLDADATTIEINLTDAGKTSLSIKDNGSGIAQEDLETIFLRHATSKITNAEDLFNIQSLGFRGEALYSVAAIADINLQSKTQSQDSGWHIHMRGSKKLTLKPCSFSDHGTEIEIKELFFNTPARKKFLKSNTAELNQILNIVIPYTLFYPEHQFKLTHQGRDIIDLKPTTLKAERMSNTLNVDQKYLLETQQEFSDKNMSLELIIGDINLQRSRRDMQFLFINGRPVHSKNISFHINDIFRLLAPPNSFPVFALYLEIPKDDVDVNIHPTKREVKIKNEQGLSSILRSVCEQTLMSASRMKEASKNPSSFNQNTIEKAFVSTHRTDNTLDISEKTQDFDTSKSFKNDSSQFSYPSTPTRTPSPAPSAQNETFDFFIPDNNSQTQQADSLQSKLENARYIGSFIHKFLLFESGNSLLLVDQHAAAERITYEQLIRQMDKGEVEVQHLLTPISIKLSPQEILIWEEVQNELNTMGFETSQWDESTIAVHTHPQLLKDIEKAIQHLLAGESIAKCDHDKIARRACRSSIMTGDKLNKEQAEFQREQLLQCLDPFTCPHGRPTVIAMSEDFLDKQFLRT